MTNIAKMRRCIVFLSFIIALFLAGCIKYTPIRALGIPGAASRTPDFVLPLSESDRRLALLYLDDKRPPGGRWKHWDDEEIIEELETMTSETKQLFKAILDMLSRKTPSSQDLASEGSIGSLFETPGADDEALDARFRGQIMTGDLRVGKLHGYYFVFYRRYPHCGDASCKDVDCPEHQYCRLVIVDEVATRRD